MLALTGYSKFIAALVAAGFIALQTTLSDGGVSLTEGLIVADAIAVAAGVYLVKNGDVGFPRYTKAVVAGLGAALAAVIAAIGPGLIGDVSADQWVAVLMTVGTAIGVFVVPNDLTEYEYVDGDEFVGGATVTQHFHGSPESAHLS